MLGDFYPGQSFPADGPFQSAAADTSVVVPEAIATAEAYRPTPTAVTVSVGGPSIGWSPTLRYGRSVNIHIATAKARAVAHPPAVTAGIAANVDVSSASAIARSWLVYATGGALISVPAAKANSQVSKPKVVTGSRIAAIAARALCESGACEASGGAIVYVPHALEPSVISGTVLQFRIRENGRERIVRAKAYKVH